MRTFGCFAQSMRRKKNEAKGKENEKNNRGREKKTSDTWKMQMRFGGRKKKYLLWITQIYAQWTPHICGSASTTGGIIEV